MASEGMTRLVIAISDDWRGPRDGRVDALLAAITELEETIRRRERQINRLQDAVAFELAEHLHAGDLISWNPDREHLVTPIDGN